MLSAPITRFSPWPREFKPFDVKKDFADNPFDIFTGMGMLLCAGDREKSAVPQKLYSNFPAGVHTMYIGRIVQAMRK